MKFSNIEFTENQIEGPAGEVSKRQNIGCIQMSVEKKQNVQVGGPVAATGSSHRPALKTSSVKVWEQDKKIAGKMSIATR
jgi:hypothetical protein